MCHILFMPDPAVVFYNRTKSSEFDVRLRHVHGPSHEQFHMNCCPVLIVIQLCMYLL